MQRPVSPLAAIVRLDVETRVVPFLLYVEHVTQKQKIRLNGVFRRRSDWCRKEQQRQEHI